MGMGLFRSMKGRIKMIRKIIHTLIVGISFLFGFILLGCQEITDFTNFQRIPTVTQITVDQIHATNTPVEGEIPTPKDAQTIIAKQTQTPLEKVAAPRIGVGILRSYADPDRTGPKDFVFDENGAIIATYPRFSSSIGFTKDPCFIYGIDGNSKGIRIRKYNWDQETLEEKNVPIRQELAHKNNNHHFSLSPNGEWISYVWLSGVQNGMDPWVAENLNLEIVNVNQVDGIPYSVTEAGGATKEGVSWSPDGKSIAYSDRDKDGVYQLYLLDLLTKNKVQISSFDQINSFQMQEIQFSPKGDFVAFTGTVTHKVETKTDRFWYEGKIGVIHLKDKKTDIYQLPDISFYPSGKLYWNDAGDHFVTVLKELTPDLKIASDFIVWFATSTGKIVHSYPEIGTAGSSITAIFPLKGIDRLIIYEKSTVFDVSTSSLKAIEFPNLCCSDFSYAPLQDVNIDSCSSRK